MENSPNKRTSKLKLIMNKKKSKDISRVHSSNQLSNSDNKSDNGSVMNSEYKMSH